MMVSPNDYSPTDRHLGGLNSGEQSLFKYAIGGGTSKKNSMSKAASPQKVKCPPINASRGQKR